MTVETPTITVVDPATEEAVGSYAEHGPEQIEAALATADAAFRAWRTQPVAERAKLLVAVAGVLRERAGELSRLVTSEVGKPLFESAFEVEKCASACEHFAQAGPAMLAEETVDAGAGSHIVSYEPIGVIFAVMPWNFPLWQVIRFAAPAILAGNTALLKHAPNVSGTAIALEEVFRQAGAPEGVFTSLIVAAGNVPEVSAKLIADPRVAAVTLTGSERAGAFVAAAAGAALKKSVLTTPSSSPTTPATASARPSGAPTPSAPTPSPAGSTPAPSRSTPSSPPTRACPSVASSAPATAASSPRSACTSSRTSAPTRSPDLQPKPHLRGQAT
jgi:succinate-semialdehyde dehydrogenase / glutarate-semialdehyde dehydrogenase